MLCCDGLIREQQKGQTEVASSNPSTVSDTIFSFLVQWRWTSVSSTRGEIEKKKKRKKETTPEAPGAHVDEENSSLATKTNLDMLKSCINVTTFHT